MGWGRRKECRRALGPVHFLGGAVGEGIVDVGVGMSNSQAPGQRPPSTTQEAAGVRELNGGDIAGYWGPRSYGPLYEEPGSVG